MESLRLECLKIASAEVQAGVYGKPDGPLEADGCMHVKAFVMARAEELLAWVIKNTKHEPEPPEPEYERLPGAVAR